MKKFEFRLQFDWRLFLRVQLTIIQIMASSGAEHAISHYLNQWWHRLVTHICVTRSQWVNTVSKVWEFRFWYSYCSQIRGHVYQQQVSRAWTSNYIPHLWDVINCPCLLYLLLVHKSAAVTSVKFQRDQEPLNLNLATSILCEMWR